jgi:hypothetical protein
MSVDGEELALVHLPRVAEALCSSLGGPCGRWPAGLRAWASSCAIMGFCSGYMAFARIEQMFHERPDAPVVYHAIAYETLLICSAVGLVATETTVILARATLPPGLARLSRLRQGRPCRRALRRALLPDLVYCSGCWSRKCHRHLRPRLHSS